jgi:hypothetical protein
MMADASFTNTLRPVIAPSVKCNLGAKLAAKRNLGNTVGKGTFVVNEDVIKISRFLQIAATRHFYQSLRGYLPKA